MAETTGERLQAGILAARQDRIQEAKDLLTSVVTIDPNSEEAWFWLGKVLSSPDQSAECFRKVLAINPDNQEAQKYLTEANRPELSFMPKGAPSGAPSSSQAFTAETEDVSLPPFDIPMDEESGDSIFTPGPYPPGEELQTNASSRLFQTPFTHPINELSEDEGDYGLSPEDRAALAAEADERVMGKSTEPTEAQDASLSDQTSISAYPKKSTVGSQDEVSKTPFPGFVEPASSPRKANPLVLGVVGFLLALILLGLPVLLLDQHGALSGILANLIQSSRVQAPPVTSTEMPTPTLTEQPTQPVSTQKPLVEPSATSVPPQSLNRRLESVHADMLRGEELIRSGKYAQAILVWDYVLSVAPEDGESHYQRGLAYLDLAEKPPRKLEEYQGYLKLAHLDLDQAIAFSPIKGEYYLARHKVLMGLAVLEEDRAQRSSFLEAAYSDAQSAIQLGILFEKGLERRPANALMAMGKCGPALDLLLDLKKPSKTELMDEVGTRIDIARAYLCNGQEEQAMAQIQSIEGLRPGNRIYWIKALILYNQKLPADALTVLDTWIKLEPYAPSPRYALRALIHYDMGQRDQARADLAAASNEGFDLTGLGAFVTARLAIDDGDFTTGNVYMTQADTRVPPDFGNLSRRIHLDFRRTKNLLPPSTPVP